MQRSAVCTCLAIVLLVPAGAPERAAGDSGPRAQAPGSARPAATAPRRIVSLVPALTEILFAIGAGSSVAAVSSFDTYPPEVEDLPRVGALLDPDVERILALRPDLVIGYGSQSEMQARFERAGIRVFSYRHGGIAAALETIRELGALTGRSAGADRLVRRLQSQLDDVRARVKGRRPRTLLVLERQPNTVRGLYASGGVGFLHEILEIAGGENVFASVAREAVQPSHETLLSQAPDVVIEIRAAAVPDAGTLRELELAWSQLASLPAVRNRRLHLLAGQHLVVPGPRLGEAAEALVQVLHPDVR